MSSAVAINIHNPGSRPRLEGKNVVRPTASWPGKAYFLWRRGALYATPYGLRRREGVHRGFSLDRRMGEGENQNKPNGRWRVSGRSSSLYSIFINLLLVSNIRLPNGSRHHLGDVILPQ